LTDCTVSINRMSGSISDF